METQHYHYVELEITVRHSDGIIETKSKTIRYIFEMSETDKAHILNKYVADLLATYDREKSIAAIRVKEEYWR